MRSYSAIRRTEHSDVAILQVQCDTTAMRARLANLSAVLGPEKVAVEAARGMAQDWLPMVFRKNTYGWVAPARGGQPLRYKGNLMKSFVWAASGSTATVSAIGPGVSVLDGMGRTESTIKARNVKVLKFRIRDKWFSRESVTIPARRFMYFPKSCVDFLHGHLLSYWVRVK
jgi:phage gpG-like protein